MCDLASFGGSVGEMRGGSVEEVRYFRILLFGLLLVYGCNGFPDFGGF